MHSRIFQVSREPIKRENFLDESRYDDYMMSRLASGSADYVVTTDSRIDDLEWLKHVTQGLKIDTENKTITILSKKEYFEKQYDEFKSLLEKLSNSTLEEFITTENSLDFYRLKEAYEAKDSFYIDDNDEYGGLMSFDEWVRDMEENVTYHVGQIFDYHF